MNATLAVTAVTAVTAVAIGYSVVTNYVDVWVKVCDRIQEDRGDGQRSTASRILSLSLNVRRFL